MAVDFDGVQYRTLNQAVNAALDTPRRRWRQIDGPDSGSGQDYWLQSRNDYVYANVDQGELLSCSWTKGMEDE